MAASSRLQGRRTGTVVQSKLHKKESTDGALATERHLNTYTKDDSQLHQSAQKTERHVARTNLKINQTNRKELTGRIDTKDPGSSASTSKYGAAARRGLVPNRKQLADKRSPNVAQPEVKPAEKSSIISGQDRDSKKSVPGSAQGAKSGIPGRKRMNPETSQSFSHGAEQGKSEYDKKGLETAREKASGLNQAPNKRGGQLEKKPSRTSESRIGGVTSRAGAFSKRQNNTAEPGESNDQMDPSSSQAPKHPARQGIPGLKRQQTMQVIDSGPSMLQSPAGATIKKTEKSYQSKQDKIIKPNAQMEASRPAAVPASPRKLNNDSRSSDYKISGTGSITNSSNPQQPLKFHSSSKPGNNTTNFSSSKLQNNTGTRSALDAHGGQRHEVESAENKFMLNRRKNTLTSHEDDGQSHQISMAEGSPKAEFEFNASVDQEDSLRSKANPKTSESSQPNQSLSQSQSAHGSKFVPKHDRARRPTFSER